MKIYQFSPLTRRRTFYPGDRQARAHIVLDDTALMRCQVRRAYRCARQAHDDRAAARWLVYDLLTATVSRHLGPA